MIETPKKIQGLSGVEKRALLAQLVQTRSHEPRTYPLSFAQQRLWFLAQLAPEVPYYNISAPLPLKIPLHVTALKRALNEIVRRHESLRTTFSVVNGQPVQVIAPALNLALPVMDLRNLPESKRATETERLATEEAHHPFDLVQGPLVRTTLLRRGEEDYVFLLTMHHIISDGWSMTVFFNELTTLYSVFCLGHPSPLSELPIQYADFAVWQRQWLRGEVLESQMAYWKQQLANLPVLRLPLDRPRPAMPTFQGGFHQVTLPENLTAELKALSQREGVTLFMTLLAAFQTLLHRYAGQDDIVVGSPIANRNRAEIEGLIGFFVNSLVMRTDLSGNPTFREALRRAREVALSAYSHQDLPFEKLVEELQPERDPSRNPLFQVMFQLFNAPSLTRQVHDGTAQAVKIHRATSNIDLGFDLFEFSGGLQGTLDYSTDLFDAATIARMATHFQILLQGIVANPDRRLSELPLLCAGERQQLLVEWNDTAAEYPREQCVHQLFEAQVDRSPDDVALVYQDKELTYGELNRRANQLAHHLRRQGVGAETLVGICLERSLEVVVGLLGILKAGGAYVPLDPDYPKERLAFMLEDARVPWLLTQERLVSQLPDHGAQLLCLDRDWEMVASATDTNPESTVKAEDLAYVIYTSGSTGRPKGVMITHRGLCNHLCWMQSTFPLTRADRIPQKYSLSFDVATVEIFAPLVAGARLIITQPGRHVDSTYLVKLIMEQRITVIDLVPSLLQLLLEDGGFASSQSLRRIICGGEALSVELQDHLAAVSSAELHNLYGPTEASLGSSFWTCQPRSDLWFVPIGRPIANTQLYILDRHLNPVPIGVCGELHIGGEGLARGYLNRPDLTAEKFIPNPFSPQLGGRLYKTGDLARYLPDGNIEFRGRVDHQVKIRGFRIELGEIEARLKQDLAVQDAAVVLRDDGEKQIKTLIDGSNLRLDKEALVQRMMTLGEDLDGLLADLENLSEDESELLLVQERKARGNHSTISRRKRRYIQEMSLVKSSGTYQRVCKLSANQFELLTLRLNGRVALSPARVASVGAGRLVAYVVPSLREGADTPLMVNEWHAEQVSQWREVYDEMYSRPSPQQDPTLNIIGWDSSYTDSPIPVEEMQEQVKYTVERILDLRPNRLLEIGCGTGLLLFRIASRCSLYCGTDFSPAALNYVRKHLRRSRLPQVSLLQKTAEDFEGVEAGSFDTVVLNSVVQYFPSIDYLVRVLEGAVKAASAGGYIFLGDVRSLPLLEAFHAAVELHRANASLSTRELRKRVRRRMKQEEELVIDPRFFVALRQHLPQIRNVKIQPKRGLHLNELTRFRYDVILQVGGQASAVIEPPWLEWEQVESLVRLRQMLQEGKPKEFGVRNMPSRRLQTEVKTVELLASPGCPETVGELRVALDKWAEGGVDPEALWQLSEELPYEVYIGWSGSGAEGLCDVLFRHVRSDLPGVVGEGGTARSRPWRAYANNPLQTRFAQKLGPLLRDSLRKELPEYMVPSTFVFLDTLPLTPNGKIDRRALPAPDHDRLRMETSFIAPRTEVERLIAAVWQEMLGLKKVGVKDNFFDLGGHSLLLVRLRSKLREVLNAQLTIIDLFQYPTISSLAKYLSQQRGEPTSFQPVQARAKKQKEVINRLRQQNTLEEITHE